MEFKEFKDYIKEAEGQCWENDCYFLYSILYQLDIKGDVLDLGSFKGRVAISFARALIDSGKEDKVYALEGDLFGTKEALLNNIKKFGFNHVIEPILTHSAKANKGWDKYFKLIWIDTGANYFSNKCDFMLWEPYLVNQGIIAFGAADSRDIKRIVDEFIVPSGRFESLTKHGPLILARKIKQGEKCSKRKLFYIRALHSLNFSIKKILFILADRFHLSGLRASGLKKIINRLFERLLIS